MLSSLFILLLTAFAFAEDPVPAIKLEDLYLLASGQIGEGAQSGILIPEWKFGASSKPVTNLNLKASVGASQLLYRPRWYSSSSTTNVDLLEAFGVYNTSFVDFYGGQTFLPWGIEGNREEQDLKFQRSLLYEQGLLPLRDSGFGVRAQAEGFYFNVFLHRGATNSSQNRVFVTGQWGYLTPNQMGLSASVTSGRYFAAAAATTETVLKGGNFAVKFNITELVVELEASYFQTHLASAQTDFLAWHGDLIWPASERVSVIGRYEQYNPNVLISSNILGRGTLGVEWSLAQKASRLLFYAIKNNESLGEYPNDIFKIAWSWGY